MKKYLFLVLFVMVAFNAFAAGIREERAAREENPASDFEYEIENREVTITGYIGERKNVVIPDRINNLPVTSIDRWAFYEKGLVSVTIPDSVKKIGRFAFENNKLIEITLGADVELCSEILGGGFNLGKNNDSGILLLIDYLYNNREAGTYKISKASLQRKISGSYEYFLTKHGAVITGCSFKFDFDEEYKDGFSPIWWPPEERMFSSRSIIGYTLEVPRYIDGNIIIGITNGAFSKKQIINIELHDSIIYIGQSAFSDNRIDSLDIPTSVKYIDDFAFSNNNLSELNIPNSVVYIGSNAFSDNGLTSVTIPDSITTINYETFVRNQLKNVIIPNSVTSINSHAFAVNELTEIIIPNSVTYIGALAFFRNKLENITIPNSVKHIGYGAFSENQLKNVTISNTVVSIGMGAFRDNLITSVNIPGSIKEMGDGIFADNQLTSVTIPDNFTSIPARMFQNNQLTTVTLPNTVKSIGFASFGNNRISAIIIPNSVTSIDDYAFSQNKLNSISIPENVDFKLDSFYASVYDKYIENDKKETTFNITLSEYNDFEIAIIDNNTLEITKYIGKNLNVNIPSYINNLPVTAIGSSSFNYDSIENNIYKRIMYTKLDKNEIELEIIYGYDDSDGSNFPFEH